MKFRSQTETTSIPEINLIPMLNVIVVILAFFVFLSMGLDNQAGVVDVTLPDDSVEPVTDPNSLDFLTVTVNPDGELNVNGTPTPKAQLLEQIPAYLNNNPDSIVLLVPDPKMPYEQTIQLLAQMRDVGGDRVSLAIGGGSEAE